MISVRISLIITLISATNSTKKNIDTNIFDILTFNTKNK
jgi:hypothetical protein